MLKSEIKSWIQHYQNEIVELEYKLKEIEMIESGNA